MTQLEAGQPCLTEPQWVVVEGGDYADNSLVECSKIGEPEQVCAFYAVFIATGEYPV